MMCESVYICSNIKCAICSALKRVRYTLWPIWLICRAVLLPPAGQGVNNSTPATQSLRIKYLNSLEAGI